MAQPLDYHPKTANAKILARTAPVVALCGGLSILLVQVIAYFWQWIFDRPRILAIFWRIAPIAFKLQERSIRICLFDILLAIYALSQNWTNVKWRRLAFIAIVLNLAVMVIYFAIRWGNPHFYTPGLGMLTPLLL
jgi:hypothetical protein